MANLEGLWIEGRYRVDRFIDSGGMCDLYKVFDAKMNTILAMKVLHEGLAEDEVVLKSFRREANAYKNLRHPNIVPCYGSYETSEAVFMLLLYIDGLTLKDILFQRRKNSQTLSVNEALTFLKVMCAALGYAHKNGVVHCDVKPGNVMVDRGGIIYMMDFGIARHAESDSTDLGGPVGTWRYMAPEQFDETVKVYNAPTDIYALGVILFEMLTGRHPFAEREADTAHSGGSSKYLLRDAHQHQPPPDPCKLNPAIPAALGQVILKAMEKHPADRYQTTDEMFIAACQAVGTTREAVNDRSYLPEIQTLQTTLISQPGGSILPPPPPAPGGLGISRKVLAGLVLAGGLILVMGAALIIFLLTRINGGDYTTPDTGIAYRVKTPTPGTINSNPLPYPTKTQPFIDVTNPPVKTVPPVSTTRSAINTPIPTSTRTPPPTAYIPPTRPPTSRPTATEWPTAQPSIDQDTIDPGQCPYPTHLENSMYAFVQTDTNIYDMPRYEHKSGYTDPKVVGTLLPGDRVWIVAEIYPNPSDRGAKNPSCSRKSYWWYVQTAFEDPSKDPHKEGWVFEYYYEHPKDDYAYFYEGYHLRPYKP